MFHGWIFGVTNIPLDSWERRVRFSICSLSPKIMVEDETVFRKVSLKSTCCWNIGLWSLSVGTIPLIVSTKSAFLETFYIAEQNTNAWTSRADCCRSGDFCCLQYPTYQAFEANGVWILEKVFDIGCNLVDGVARVWKLHTHFWPRSRTGRLFDRASEDPKDCFRWEFEVLGISIS